MKKQKYLFQCKFCGRMLMKTEAAIFMEVEIKCPQCKRVLLIPVDTVITREKPKVFHGKDS